MTLAGAAALPSAAQANSCPDAGLQPSAGTLQRTETATLCLMNQQRANAGTPPLSENPTLDQAARQHSRDMVANQYFDHFSPTQGGLVTRLTDLGYIHHGERWHAAEDLGWGTGSFATPSSIVTAWMNSPDHRHNLLNPGYHAVGLGVAFGAPLPIAGRYFPGATYTADFGARTLLGIPSKRVRRSHRHRRGHRRHR